MQVIIVEGKKDEQKLRSIFSDILVVSVGGLQMNTDTIKYLESLSQSHEIIIFTDPDSAGNKIRNSLTSLFPNASHAYISQTKAISDNQKKIGIEHVSNEDIKYALRNIIKPTVIGGSLTTADLLELGLTQSSNAAALRQQVSTYLNIGNPNAKQFLNRINILNITKARLKDVIKSSS